MNRRKAPGGAIREPVPHARGDEPVDLVGGVSSISRSPRPWG